MIRQIINIDEEKCNGCGLCVQACHEGAIGIVDGKAKLLRDDYCDGLGNCLPVCPAGAIAVTEREAKEYDEQAIKNNRKMKPAVQNECPGSKAASIARTDDFKPSQITEKSGELVNWPVQIRLVPVKSAYFDGAPLLVAADCAAYARAQFHKEFIRGKTTLIGCPKLDDIDYAVKLFDIISSNDIKSLTVVRMEVPCCGGIEQAAVAALKKSGKFIPWQVVTLGLDGEIQEK